MTKKLARVTRLHSCRPRAKKKCARRVSTRVNATLAGLLQIIKSYCPWVWQETAHRKKYCKQMKNNVLVSTACPCACAGY
jgi:hypothetical protein